MEYGKLKLPRLNDQEPQKEWLKQGSTTTRTVKAGFEAPLPMSYLIGNHRRPQPYSGNQHQAERKQQLKLMGILHLTFHQPYTLDELDQTRIVSLSLCFQIDCRTTTFYDTV